MNLLRFLPDAWKESMRQRAGVITARGRLENLRKGGFHPKRIIDAGAFRGDWTRLVLDVFPDAAVLMIEPQQEQCRLLAQFAGAHPNLRVRNALLGAGAKQVRFLIEGTNSRVIPDEWNPPAGSRVEVRSIETLSSVAAEASFADCDFLKLDLQGHELEALDGAGSLFGRCEVIIAETSWLPIGNVPIVFDVISRFDAAGYRLYDIYGHNYRPLDGALWQTDFVWVRSDSKLISDLRWAR